MDKMIPVENRNQLLKQTSKELLDEISGLRKTKLLKEAIYEVGIVGIVYAWTVTEEFDNNQTAAAKAKYIEHKVDGDTVVAKLQRILNDDEHLFKCCGTPIILAKLLGLFFDHVFSITNGEIPSDEEFNEAFDSFVMLVYAEPFAFVTYSHVFNLELYADQLDFGDCQIHKLAHFEIPLLLNENTNTSLLHFPDAGHFFIVRETQDPVTNDVQYLIDAHISAGDLVRIFKYFKDGVVHLGYTTNVFRPNWLNGIRKNGSFHVGETRKYGYKDGFQKYEISETEYETLARWLLLFDKPEIQALFRDERNGLGKTIEFAGYYYESSHSQSEDERRLIDLAIALESEFSPGNKDEITFQLSQFCAEFVGDTSVEKISIFDFIKAMYGKRSNLLHGNHHKYEKSPITKEELDRFSSIIRRALLKLVVLYIDGADDHKEIIKRIREGLFNSEIRIKLQAASNIEMLVAKLLSKEETV